MRTNEATKNKLREALRLADAGDWDGAHALVQELEEMGLPLVSWLHANLHREEGDTGNARYWYGQAGRSFPQVSFGEERRAIRAALDAQSEHS